MSWSSRTSSTVPLMSPSAGRGWGGRTTWRLGNLWSFWHVLQLRDCGPSGGRRSCSAAWDSWAGGSTYEVSIGSWLSKTGSSQGGGACSRARSTPWAHRARSRTRSVPRAHRVRSWNRSSQMVVVCSTLVASCPACPALAPPSANSSRPSSTPRAWPTPLLDIFLF